jgi:hypothetical protein
MSGRQVNAFRRPDSGRFDLIPWLNLLCNPFREMCPKSSESRHIWGHSFIDYLLFSQTLTVKIARSTMIRRRGALLCLLAVFQLLGGPLTVLQTIAWARMMITYSQNAGVALGIAKTFDGQHLCHLCKAIAKNRDSEHKDATGFSLVKIDLQCPVVPAQLFPPRGF